MKESERGAALLSVLLLVAVMAVLAASALERLKLSTHLAANGAAMDQARAYGAAAETLALLRITDLVQRDQARSTLAGDWNGKRFGLPIPGGIAGATVRDGGNCFNLNSVARGEEATTLVPDQTGIDQFAALMAVLGVEPPVAARVAASLADWIDADDIPAPGGAEDAFYRGLAVPYLPANTRVEDVSELRAVAGVTPALYARLRPWLCALPVSALSRINVYPDGSYRGMASKFLASMSRPPARCCSSVPPRDMPTPPNSGFSRRWRGWARRSTPKTRRPRAPTGSRSTSMSSWAGRSFRRPR